MTREKIADGRILRLHPPVCRWYPLRRLDVGCECSRCHSQCGSRTAVYSLPASRHARLFRAIRDNGPGSRARESTQEVVPSQEGSTDRWRLGRPEGPVPSPRPRIAAPAVSCPPALLFTVVVPVALSKLFLDQAGIGCHIVSNRLGDGLWASTNPRDGPNGCAKGYTGYPG